MKDIFDNILLYHSLIAAAIVVAFNQRGIATALPHRIMQTQRMA